MVKPKPIVIRLFYGGEPFRSRKGVQFYVHRPFTIEWPVWGVPAWEPLTDALIVKMGFAVYDPPPIEQRVEGMRRALGRRR